MASTVSAQDFPNVAQVIRNRSNIAANRRQEELQPGRLEGQQQTNELNAFNLRQNVRTEANQAETARLLTDLQNDVPGAFRQLAIQNPERLTTVLEAQAKKRDMDLNAFNTRLLAIGRMATAFAGNAAADKAVAPEEQQRQYTQSRDALVRRFPEITEEDVPLKPNSLFLKRAMSALSGVAELQKQAGFGQGTSFVQTGVKDQPGATQTRRVPTAGPEADIGPPKLPAPAAGRGGAGGGVTTAASNTILRAVNGLFGDIFDLETGRINVLDEDKRQDMLAVAARAEQLTDQEGLPPLQAVRQAASELGIQFPDVGPASGASVNRARPGVESETRTKQLKAFRDFVNKQ
jgi:hypothetical protein